MSRKSQKSWWAGGGGGGLRHFFFWPQKFWQPFSHTCSRHIVGVPFVHHKPLTSKKKKIAWDISIYAWEREIQVKWGEMRESHAQCMRVGSPAKVTKFHYQCIQKSETACNFSPIKIERKLLFPIKKATKSSEILPCLESLIRVFLELAFCRIIKILLQIHGNTSKHYRYNTVARNFTIERHNEVYTGNFSE